VPDQREVGAVYVGALAQGVALVTFPAASSILTSPAYYGLSSTAYGGLFLPQAIAAISASLAGASLTRRLGARRILLLGLAADLASMVMLFASQFAIGAGLLPYAMLLIATTSLGIGFGLAVPALDTFAAAFDPARADRAVLVLNALLGLGTALAPLLVATFLGLGVWSGLPALVALALAGSLLFMRGLRLSVGSEAGSAHAGGLHLPRAFWVFAAFAVCYGVVETVNANWSTLYMTGTIGASASVASLALTAFWALVTVGRVLFAAIERWAPESAVYRVLPFATAVVLVIIGLMAGGPAGGVLAFGAAGLGCSALLPLTVSFGQRRLGVMAASVAGLIIAFYQVGYGLAAFGVGPLLDAGISLSAVYEAAALVAIGMGLLSFRVLRGLPSPMSGAAVTSADTPGPPGRTEDPG
jgi:fucose permease